MPRRRYGLTMVRGLKQKTLLCTGWKLNCSIKGKFTLSVAGQVTWTSEQNWLLHMHFIYLISTGLVLFDWNSVYCIRGYWIDTNNSYISDCLYIWPEVRSIRWPSLEVNEGNIEISHIQRMRRFIQKFQYHVFRPWLTMQVNISCLSSAKVIRRHVRSHILFCQ